MKYSVMALVSAFVFAAGCTTNVSEKAENEGEKTNAQAKMCTYHYDQKDVRVAFTAYKLKNKTGVGGEFGELEIDGKDATSSVPALLSGTKIRIPVSSLSTGNSERDGKILSAFFGSMEETQMLSGSLENVEGDDQSGTVYLQLLMNGKTHPVSLDYSVSSDTLILVGSMNVPDWGGRSALDSLNTVCAAKHTDEDGSSTIWEDVGLEVTVPLSKECD